MPKIAISGDEDLRRKRAIATRMPGRVDRSRAEKLAGFASVIATTA